MEYVSTFGGKLYFNFVHTNAVQFLLGVPRILRADYGTENTNLAFIQPYLRRSHTDCFAESESFRYGRSVSNQV